MQTKPHLQHYRFASSVPKKVVKKMLKAIQKDISVIGELSPLLADVRTIRAEFLDDPAAKGGVTIARNMDTGDTAVALCSADDAFNRKVGRTIASERLEKINQ